MGNVTLEFLHKIFLPSMFTKMWEHQRILEIKSLLSSFCLQVADCPIKPVGGQKWPRWRKLRYRYKMKKKG